MRIAFIDVTVTVSYGGIQTAVWQLAKALVDLGHEVSVFGGTGAIRPDLQGRTVDIQTFPFTPREKVPDFGSRFRRIIERWTFARHAKSSVATAGFDWVILTKPFDFFWPRLIPEESKTRFAFMSGGTDFFVGDRFLAKKIDAWLACSHFNAWQIKGRYKRYPHVMYNGVDVAQFSPEQVDPTLREKLGVDENEVLFAFAGRLVGWKGLRVAIKALADPAARDLPLKLLIIGNGDDRPTLKRLANELGVERQVIFHDPLPHHDLPRYYANADAGIFPSIGDEAFGITIAEAMSCGIPVVASNVGGIPEVVGNESSAGLLVTPGDSVELAQAMATLAASAELRQRMGEAARQRITRLYTWELAAQRLLAELQR